MRKRNGFRASCLLLFCLGKPIGKEERWKVSKCQIEMFWLVEQRTENPLSPGRLDLKSNRSEWFESTSERTMNECGKSSSIVVLLLIDSGFG